MTELDRTIEISPAYDKRNADPHKNYGIHGVDMRFLVSGPEGAVQFLIYTGWHLPHVQKELNAKTALDPSLVRILRRPMAADLGYHSPKPMYEGHEPRDIKDCPYIGAPCYYDGSGLNAEKVFDIMVEKGGDAMWKYLENYYKELFEESDEICT